MKKTIFLAASLTPAGVDPAASASLVRERSFKRRKEGGILNRASVFTNRKPRPSEEREKEDLSAPFFYKSDNLVEVFFR
jgi:hypothetical protein